MNPPLEKDLRAYVAQHLNLIGSDLKLVQEEYPLPNPAGAKGYIDILCRDGFGHYVVIELKRSDSSARQALHELYKYAGLLRMNFGLAPEKIRCVLLATHWHELLIPFSELHRTWEYHIEGYRIDIDPSSRELSLSLKPITPVPEASISGLCPSHMVYLFSDANRRDRATPGLLQALEKVGIHSACVVLLDYSGDDSRVIYPYAQYLAIDALRDDERQALLSKASDRVAVEEEYGVNPSYFEESAIGEVFSHYSAHDTAEVGSPEKFVGLLDRWTVRSVMRQGRLAVAQEIFSDQDIVWMIASTEGGNAITYFAILNPKFGPAWKAAMERVEYTLRGNSLWEEGVAQFLGEVQQVVSEATVSVMIYNPLDTITHLYGYTKTRNPNYLPKLEIIVDTPRESKMLALLGRLSWNGIDRPQPVAEVMTRVFGDPFDFFTTRVVGGLWSEDEAIIRHLGLNYGLQRVLWTEGGEVTCEALHLSDNGQLEMVACSDEESFSVPEYLAANSGLSRELRVFFNQYSNY